MSVYDLATKHYFDFLVHCLQTGCGAEELDSVTYDDRRRVFDIFLDIASTSISIKQDAYNKGKEIISKGSFPANISKEDRQFDPLDYSDKVCQTIFVSKLVCLKDGAKRSHLGRYVKSKFGLTMEGYRLEHCLPSTYPSSSPLHCFISRNRLKDTWDSFRDNGGVCLRDGVNH